jgi:hypothetical protein
MKSNILNPAKILILGITILTLNACTKETPKNNTASIVFWYNKTTADRNKNAVFNYFVRGKRVGFETVTYHWDEAPSCGSKDAVTYKYDLGESTEETILIEVRSQFDLILNNVSITVKKDSCTSYQVMY